MMNTSNGGKSWSITNRKCHALLASEVIRPFALVMPFGVFTGTFSSIYVASPLLMLIEQRWPGQDARGARTFDMRAATEPAR